MVLDAAVAGGFTGAADCRVTGFGFEAVTPGALPVWATRTAAIPKPATAAGISNFFHMVFERLTVPLPP